MLELPLSSLRIGAANVRADSDMDDNLAILMASIASVGLLQPLVVAPSDDGGFEVVAGRRRFTALQKLAEDGKATDTVPCFEVPAEVAGEASLAENYVRESMDTRETYTAFQRMKDGGKSEDDIAAAFGFTPDRVKRILRLANLAEPIRDAWFAGEMEDGMAQAYAATDNHEIQLAVLDRLGTGSYYRPGHIRSEIMTLLSKGASMRELAFVGIEAYETAGGKVERDLFSDAIAILDPDILTKLATKKLAAEKKALAKKLGCKIDWGAPLPQRPSGYGYMVSDYDCRIRLEGAERFASEADEKRAAEIDAEFEALEEAAISEDEYQAKAEALQEELDAIMDRKVIEPPRIEGVERVIGADGTIGFDGKFDYQLWYASREDAGLPPIEEEEEDESQSSTRDYGSVTMRPAHSYEGAGRDTAIANKKAMGAGKDALAAMQVIFADTVASECFFAADNGGDTAGLDTLLFILARRVVFPHTGPAGLPDIRLGEGGGRGPYKVRQLAGNKPDLDKVLEEADWLTEKSDARAYDGFRDWVAFNDNRAVLGAALLKQLWHPLSESHTESNKPPIVRLVAERMDPGPIEWASRFDRGKLAEMMSHKARVQLLESWGLGDHAKGLKKATSTEFLMKVLGADAEQRKLWDIDEETGAEIDAWLPVECLIEPVKRPGEEPAADNDETPVEEAAGELEEELEAAE